MTTTDLKPYTDQGFGAQFQLEGSKGLLIVDFVNGFADPDVFGGGNIRDAIKATIPLLAFARNKKWPVAYSRIVFADDDSDQNIFTQKVPGLLTLKEHTHNSAIVSELASVAGELVVRKTIPSAFFGTMLTAWLAQRGVQTLFIAGAVTSGCVRASVVDAMSNGFKPVVLSDCVGDRALGPHEANLFDIRQKYAMVMTAEEAMLAVSKT